MQDTSAIPSSAYDSRSTAGMTTKVFKGSFWTLIGQVAPMAASLIATPFVIRLLGSEGYGVLILVGLIPTYLAFADFGMGLASTKFCSEAYGAHDPDREARILRTAAVINLCVSIPVAALMFGLSSWLVTLFNVPNHLTAEASAALKVTAIAFVLNILNGIFNTPQLARLRMDLNTLVTSGFRIAGITVTPIIIYFGGGILGAVFVQLLASLLTFAGHIYISGKLLPQLFDLTLDRSIIRSLLRFGYPVGLTLVAAALLINVEKAVLTRVADVQTLAHYSVAFTFAGMATMFSLSMLQSLMPAFSQLLLPEARPQLEKLYARAIRLNIIVILPILFVMFIAARPLFTIWAGTEFGKESTLPFYILISGLFFNMLAYVSQALLLSAGRTDIIAKVNWFELIPYIAVTTLLTIRFGAIGAAASWSLRVFADCFIIIHFAERLEGLRLPISQLAVQISISILILAPAMCFAVWVDNWSLWLPLITFVSCLFYSGFIWRFAVDPDEKNFLQQKIQLAISALRNTKARA